MKTETINRVFGAVGKVLLIGTLLTLPRLTRVEYVTKPDDQRTVGYYDAVLIIMGLNMLASDKRAYIEAMKRDASEDYYLAAIEIAESSMLGSDKIAAIKIL